MYATDADVFINQERFLLVGFALLLYSIGSLFRRTEATFEGEEYTARFDEITAQGGRPFDTLNMPHNSSGSCINSRTPYSSTR